MVIADFPGLVTNADPNDLPPGACSDLVNLAPRRVGSLESRRGLRQLSFQSQATVSLAAVTSGFAIYVNGTSSQFVYMDYISGTVFTGTVPS